MWHNLLWIGGIWVGSTIIAWLICRWRGYSVGAWALAITAFCLGLFAGAENSPKGRFNVPFLSSHHRHLLHHTASSVKPVSALTASFSGTGPLLRVIFDSKQRSLCRTTMRDTVAVTLTPRSVCASRLRGTEHWSNWLTNDN